MGLKLPEGHSDSRKKWKPKTTENFEAESVSELVFIRLEDLSVRLEELIDSIYENSNNRSYDMSRVLVALESFHLKINEEEANVLRDLTKTSENGVNESRHNKNLRKNFK